MLQTCVFSSRIAPSDLQDQLLMATMAIFFKDGFAAEIQLDFAKVVVQVPTSGCPILHCKGHTSVECDYTDFVPVLNHSLINSSDCLQK